MCVGHVDYCFFFFVNIYQQNISTIQFWVEEQEKSSVGGITHWHVMILLWSRKKLAAFVADRKDRGERSCSQQMKMALHHRLRGDAGVRKCDSWWDWNWLSQIGLIFGPKSFFFIHWWWFVWWRRRKSRAIWGVRLVTAGGSLPCVHKRVCLCNVCTNMSCVLAKWLVICSLWGWMAGSVPVLPTTQYLSCFSDTPGLFLRDSKKGTRWLRHLQTLHLKVYSRLGCKGC